MASRPYLAGIQQSFLSKFIPGLQTARHALTLAHIALHAQIKRQGQVFGGLQVQAKLAYAGAARKIRLADVVAVGGRPRLAVKLMLLSYVVQYYLNSLEILALF